MLKPSMNDLLSNIDNRYLLVNLAAQRARDISEEALETGEKLNDKAVKLALDEIAAGMIHYCPGPKPQAPAVEHMDSVAPIDLDFDAEDDDSFDESDLEDEADEEDPEEE